MSKNVLLGMVAFGGIVLIAVLLPDSDTKPNPEVMTEEVGIITLPSDLPSAFPIYPNSEVKSVRDTDGETSRDLSITLSALTTKNEINNWYRTAMSSNGWTIKSDKNVAGYQIIQSENDNLYTSIQAANGHEPGEIIISQSLKIRK